MRAILIVGMVVLLLYFLSKAAAPAAAPATVAPPPRPVPYHVPAGWAYGTNPNSADREQPPEFGYGYMIPDVVGRGDPFGIGFLGYGGAYGGGVAIRAFR